MRAPHGYALYTGKLVRLRLPMGQGCGNSEISLLKEQSLFPGRLCCLRLVDIHFIWNSTGSFIAAPPKMQQKVEKLPSEWKLTPVPVSIVYVNINKNTDATDRSSSVCENHPFGIILR